MHTLVRSYMQQKLSFIALSRQQLMTAILAFFTVGVATAFVQPVAGDFGFEIYDIVVNQMIGGPIGYIAAILVVLWGISQIFKQWMIGIMAFVVAGIIIQADTLIQTLGYCI